MPSHLLVRHVRTMHELRLQAYKICSVQARQIRDNCVCAISQPAQACVMHAECCDLARILHAVLRADRGQQGWHLPGHLQGHLGWTVPAACPLWQVPCITALFKAIDSLQQTARIQPQQAQAIICRYQSVRRGLQMHRS